MSGLGEGIRKLRERTWLGFLPKGALGHGRTLDAVVETLQARLPTARSDHATSPILAQEPPPALVHSSWREIGARGSGEATFEDKRMTAASLPVVPYRPGVASFPPYESLRPVAVRESRDATRNVQTFG